MNRHRQLTPAKVTLHGALHNCQNDSARVIIASIHGALAYRYADTTFDQDAICRRSL